MVKKFESKMKPNRRLKKPHTSSKLILEEIIGLTTKNGNGLASTIWNSNCIYMAGCVVVIYNVDSGTQSHLMVSNRPPKPLSCVAVSQDGYFVAAGESGHLPAVLVWDCKSLASASELKGHQYGVACMDFSPDGKFLVSIGFPHDGYLCLWDWRSRTLVTKLKACSSSSAVTSVSFSSDAKFIVTAGKKHLKFWTVGSSTRSRVKTGSGSLTMHGKPVNLGNHKGSSFIAVTSPNRTDSGLIYCNQAGDFIPVYALTSSGILCLLRSGLTITKSVDLKVDKGFALAVSDKLVACSCNSGLVKLFTIDSLKDAGSLQRTEGEGCNKINDIDSHSNGSENEFQPLPNQPDAVACQFSNSEKLVVIYGDHSLYIWDIHDRYKATKCCVLVSHNACIWDIKNLSCENMHDPSLACVARGCPGGVSFATCSADGTIRLWDLALQPFLSEDSSSFDKEQCSVITEPLGTTCLVSAGIFERESVVSGVRTKGFRAMAVSSNGEHLAAGDCVGNLHIYNLHTSDYICIQDVHDAEILSLSFSLPVKKDAFSEQLLESHYLLATGGQDQMIYLYDVERNFDIIGSVHEHSAAVTSVELIGNGRKIISCSVDRSLVLHDVATPDTDCNISRCNHQMESHGPVYDMTVDPTTEVVITAGQDKKVNIFNIAAGKLIRSFKQDGDFGDPMKLAMDPSGTYLVCSYSNKSICMFDLTTGEMVARAVGHAEVITGVIFLPDCKHLVSVGGDGCIFVWKVPAPLSSRMLRKVEENLCPFPPTSMAHPAALGQNKIHEEHDHLGKINPNDLSVPEYSNQIRQRLLSQGGGPQAASAFKFSISRLPKWAQDKVTSSKIIPTDPEFTSLQQGELQYFSPLVGNGEVYAPVLLPHTPSNHDLEEVSKQFPWSISKGSSVTDNSGGFTTPQENCRSFALDKRWLTIHTVCLDLLNSPEAWDMKNMKVPVSFSNSSQDPDARMTNSNKCMKLLSADSSVNNSSVQPTFLLCNHDDLQCAIITEHTELKHSGTLCSATDQLQIINASACHDEVVPEVSEQLQWDTTERGVETTIDINVTNMNSQANDMFSLNLGNLSSKLKTAGKKSAARRSYSARFVVRRDLLTNRRTLFDTPVRNFVGEMMNRGKDPCLDESLEDLSLQVLEELPRATSCKEDMANSTQNFLIPDCIFSQYDSAGSSATDKAEKAEVVHVKDQEERDIEGSEKQKTIIACKKALLNLDAATESALQLFSKLESLASSENILEEPEAQLYAEATEMLPSIAKKIQAVSQLAQTTYNNSCGNAGVNLSSFKPLLGS